MFHVYLISVIGQNYRRQFQRLLTGDWRTHCPWLSSALQCTITFNVSVLRVSVRKWRCSIRNLMKTGQHLCVLYCNHFATCFVQNKKISVARGIARPLSHNLFAVELFKAHLYRALRCKDSGSDCPANVYLTVFVLRYRTMSDDDRSLYTADKVTRSAVYTLYKEMFLFT